MYNHFNFIKLYYHIFIMIFLLLVGHQYSTINNFFKKLLNTYIYLLCILLFYLCFIEFNKLYKN